MGSVGDYQVCACPYVEGDPRDLAEEVGQGGWVVPSLPGRVVKTRDHFVFQCAGTRGFADWDWKRWVDLDDKSKWAYEYEDRGRVKVGNWVEDSFAGLDNELCGIG